MLDDPIVQQAIDGRIDPYACDLADMSQDARSRWVPLVPARLCRVWRVALRDRALLELASLYMAERDVRPDRLPDTIERDLLICERRGPWSRNEAEPPIGSRIDILLWWVLSHSEGRNGRRALSGGSIARILAGETDGGLSKLVITSAV
jgi:hypothetical protein